MSATITGLPDYERELDPARPLTEPFGGRFLTPDEANLVSVGLSRGAENVEMIAQNLEHLRSNVVDSGPAHVLKMTGEDLAELVVLADDVRRQSDLLREQAEQIHSIAVELYDYRDDDSDTAVAS